MYCWTHKPNPMAQPAAASPVLEPVARQRSTPRQKMTPARSVNVISAFSSDGRIAAENLVVLTDVKHAIPSYDAVILVSGRRRNDETVRRARGALATGGQ